MQNAVFGFVASFQDDKTCHSKVFAGVAVGLALHRTISYLRRSQRQSELQKQAEKKRMIRDQARDAFIIEAKKYGSSPDAATHEHAVAVCDMTAQELAEKFQASLSNESSVEDTMRVLALRAAGAGRTLGSNAEELFSEAMEIAKSLDQEPVVQRQSKPLFGVGVSIKDCINVRGCDSTCGLAAKTFQPAQEDSVIVEMLRDAGAIPFVRGNIPQCLMIPESSNAIWGTALNPWNIARTPGGSSGGEAALVACGAAPIAIGTDIGGSIRIPSNCCGVYGFKPTPERISNLGIPAPRPKGENGQRGIVASPGPIARCVADLVSVMRVWWQPYATNKMFQRDPYIPPVEFNESSFSGTAKKTLRIGYYTDDAYCESAPSFKRAVLQAKAALEQAGHTVVPFEVPSATEYPDIMFQVLSADGNMQGFMDGYVASCTDKPLVLMGTFAYGRDFFQLQFQQTTLSMNTSQVQLQQASPGCCACAVEWLHGDNVRWCCACNVWSRGVGDVQCARAWPGARVKRCWTTTKTCTAMQPSPTPCVRCSPRCCGGWGSPARPRSYEPQGRRRHTSTGRALPS
eukprot:m.641015 g.641015  ORF g.641015 m.641015 type:complete len:572 (-) comp22626_c0_seq3:1731-3446(-)